jgi:hypothetical protein
MIKKFFDKRIWAILSACIAVLMLVFLATSLGGLHFQPGRPLAQGDSITIRVSVEKMAEEIASIPLWKQVVFWVLVSLLVFIVACMFSPEWRKRILKYFLRFALFVLAVFYLVRNIRGLLPALNLDITGAPENNKGSVDTALAVFTPPKIPSALLYLISLGVLLTFVFSAFLISRWWMHRQRLQKVSQPLENLAEVARSSLVDISAGRNWEDAIIKCYARMNEVVDAQRGLRRRMDLTASEYAKRLEGAGLPGEAVRRLTCLFEVARYGSRQTSREETAEAIACLTTILHACGVNE